MKRTIKSTLRILSAVMVVCMAFSAVFAKADAKTVSAFGEQTVGYVTEITGLIDNQTEKYFDETVAYKLPSAVSVDDEISVIITLDEKSVMDEYETFGEGMTVSEFSSTPKAQAAAQKVEEAIAAALKKLDDDHVYYALGEKYDTLLAGFEVTVKAGSFDNLVNCFGNDALIVGDVYEKCETQVVENYVDVYDTGIFDSSNSKYQGDGVVVAVLDTGLDYTHTAFSVDNFTTEIEAFTLESVSQKLGETAAASFTYGLKGEDVYVSKKVPYAYDYADKDPDVLPISSEHGTHVAGIIAGKDDTITGVAPNAQLAIMKVFSDTATGAKSSWLIAALEDCVVLGVDVINMSLGSGCGFTREVDKDNVNAIYDRIGAAGISLIASAANSYNATLSSKKNGTNGLTKHPDSGTVGSPSTYESALSVASVDGVKTSYLTYEGKIIYFNQATNSAAKEKDFVAEILKTVGDVDSYTFEYVTIAGIGRSSDYFYDSDYYRGKIVLVKRGTTTFEEKIRIALVEKGAAGIIVYNNISGTISMSVGKDMGAACSISQDDGEMLAANPTGYIKVSKAQTAGPFMSDFSSWGPTSDLKIKPEITAHGGQILSAVPGQAYDRLSGTSMAAPNQAGATALIRQFVKYDGIFGNDLDELTVTATVNKLMMSTADIIYNKNGLPYAVRKQGAGLINITKSYTTASYITTYNADGTQMDKSKLELGDDKNKTGVYEATFDVNNFSSQAVSYDIGAIVMTEGVSSTYTGHSDTTVSQEGYLLGANCEVTAVTGGTKNGSTVSISAKGTAKVTVRITLTDEDKEYLNKSFQYGMYVEGFVTYKATSGTTVDMNVPFLGFYGDWTEAPIFDEEYYDTNVDELNKGLDDDDKLTADAYATRVIGGTYSDYIVTMGSYYFVQNPTATQIAANKDKIALSNQANGDGTSSVNKIRDVWAGLMRNAKRVDISIVEDSTGEVIFTRSEYNQKKSFSSGGNVIQSSVEMEFDALENDLKNNTRYTVTLTAYIDYGADEDQHNARNVFTFPLYVDFEAPAVTDVVYRTEYDRSSKKTKLFADVYVYDNHYAMAMQFGQIVHSEDTQYTYSMKTFNKYITPIYSTFNNTSVVTLELTDYINDIKNSIGIAFDDEGNSSVVENNNSYVLTVYDYAMNYATYEIRLPDDIKYLYFNEQTLKMSPNETVNLGNVLNVYPSDSWISVLDFSSSDPSIADVVNGTILAKESGAATITAIGYDAEGNKVEASIDVTVLAKGDEGYVKYDTTGVNKFSVTGYETDFAFYKVSNEDREIGVTGSNNAFGEEYELKMFPSEKVTLQYSLDSYFVDKTEVKFSVGNTRVATVSPEGQIVAVAEGTTIVNVSVLFNGKQTSYTQSIYVTVKDPFTAMSIYLMSYNGNGGEVVIPDDRGITTIYSYAFAGYEYVEKDLENGDVIDEEDPYYIKQHYIGNDTITKIVIPEGVIEIQDYAFAYLTSLEEVVMPSTLARIGKSAFEGCEKLTTINLGNAKFINEKAFYGCALTEIDLSSVVSIGNYTFADNDLGYVELPESSQSLGRGAFASNPELTSVTFRAKKIKIASGAFADCPKLTDVEINAAVISSYAFNGCSELKNVTLGKDVAVIGEFAFTGTKVERFELSFYNEYLELAENGALVYDKDGTLILAAPKYSGVNNAVTLTATRIGSGAFAGNELIFSVNLPNAEYIGDYAFAACSNLKTVNAPALIEIGDYAFAQAGLTATPALGGVEKIGARAFAYTDVKNVAIPEGCDVGEYAFAWCYTLSTVTVGDNAMLGEACFYCPVALRTYQQTQNFDYYTTYNYDVLDENGQVVETYTYYTYNFSVGVTSAMNALTIGSSVKIGNYAFNGNAKLAAVTLGEGATIGDYAFFNCAALEDVDLSAVLSIGDYAFSGSLTQDYWLYNNLYNYAYNVISVGGEKYYRGYKFTAFAPVFTSCDVSGATSIGEGAFANNGRLTSVTLAEGETAIADYAFANCSALASFDFEGVKEVGERAFYNTAMTSVDLTTVETIGDYAFSQTKLTQVTLADGAKIGEAAFANSYNLASVNGLDKASEIGAYAFVNSALTSVDLASATVIGDFAFRASKITSVKFGNAIDYIGENPFYLCPIQTFGLVENVEIGGNIIGTTTTESYTISDKAFVEDGVLYYRKANGYMLVCYPMNKLGSSFTVAEGTVRISATAFAGSAIESVTLPHSLKSMGDKAFYGCKNLKTVIFLSYYAPTFEEAYDATYETYDNLPLTGHLSFKQQSGGPVYNYDGLGVVKYYMWNYNSNRSCYYFGASFVDYIGHIENKIVMVRPTNGKNYDTFITSQYFGTTVDGAAAATDYTVSVITLISKISDYVTLSDETTVAAARNAYNAITSEEQKALVSNYENLVKAENTIEYLKQREQNPEPEIEPQPPEEPISFGQFMLNNLFGLCLALAVAAGFVVYVVITKRKSAKQSEKSEE